MMLLCPIKIDCNNELHAVSTCCDSHIKISSRKKFPRIYWRHSKFGRTQKSARGAKFFFCRRRLPWAFAVRRQAQLYHLFSHWFLAMCAVRKWTFFPLLYMPLNSNFYCCNCYGSSETVRSKEQLRSHVRVCVSEHQPCHYMTINNFSHWLNVGLRDGKSSVIIPLMGETVFVQ